MTDPQTAADAAERMQRWLDAVREHGRRDTGYPDEDDVDSLLEDRKRMAAELEQVRGERDDDAERIEYATDLLIALARTSPCLQEKGGCITHDRYLPEGSDCPHGLARAFIAGAKARRSIETTASTAPDATGDTQTAEQRADGERDLTKLEWAQRGSQGDAASGACEWCNPDTYRMGELCNCARFCGFSDCGSNAGPNWRQATEPTP